MTQETRDAPNPAPRESPATSLSPTSLSPTSLSPTLSRVRKRTSFQTQRSIRTEQRTPSASSAAVLGVCTVRPPSTLALTTGMRKCIPGPRVWRMVRSPFRISIPALGPALGGPSPPHPSSALVPSVPGRRSPLTAAAPFRRVLNPSGDAECDDHGRPRPRHQARIRLFRQRVLGGGKSRRACGCGSRRAGWRDCRAGLRASPPAPIPPTGRHWLPTPRQTPLPEKNQ